MITAIIMASGFSRRIGERKLLLKINNKPIVEWVIDLVDTINFHEEILVYRDKEIEAIGKKRGFKTVFNDKAIEGMSSSMKLGILNSSKKIDGYIFFTADQPFLDVKAIEKLMDSFYQGKGSIIVPRFEGQRGNPVIFHSKWRESLLDVKGDKGGRDIIKNNLNEVYFLDISSARQGMDIDTWEDYRSAVKNKIRS